MTTGICWSEGISQRACHRSGWCGWLKCQVGAAGERVRLVRLAKRLDWCGWLKDHVGTADYMVRLVRLAKGLGWCGWLRG